ncbi:MAG TPA: adenylate/guanylate cyclase domain-containing protein [Chitinophagaceae bacterium]|nr:adenylate/guanylate cyclase domain-containing protein [Chitinophagaceae bacterium]HNF71624.1 adenylate/guanylate cyclase domain-containing protein [Chitinophagaceae bacterium]
MINRLILFIKNYARVEGDHEELIFSKQLIVIVSLCCWLCGLLWGALYYWLLGPGLSMCLPWAFVVIVGTAIPVAHWKRNHFILVYAELICITWIPALIQWTLGSINDSAMILSWSFLGPIGALLFLNQRQALLFLLQFLGIILITVLIEPKWSNDALHAGTNYRMLFYLMNLFAPSIVIYLASNYFLTNLSKQKKLSDDLLLNILPKTVADEIKTKGYADPKFFDKVTVMFTDFKDFTKISEHLSAAELVAEINYCFSEFDKIISKYNLEKIKTIGDSYMCAAGLSKQSVPSAHDSVYAALEICEFMKKERQIRKQEGKAFFEVRVGCHTGQVVAGVVGIKKFAYDVWGDTVNIASRMESSGEEGRVNISGATYELVRDQFHCVHRGKVAAKNKGEIEMYFVEASQTQAG